MSTIYIKELKSYFKSLYGWFFLAFFTFFAGLFFVLVNIDGQSPYIADSLYGMLMVLLFLIPVLTMRSFSEEKKQKTDQLLLTAPIRISSIVLGKFFAMVTIMGIATLITSLGVFILDLYGSVPVAETIMSLLGFFLYGCICIAVGMFLSAVTEHQFISAILTYGVFIFILLVPPFCSTIFGSDSWIMSVMNAIDIILRFELMFSGILLLTDVIYIFSAILLFIVLTCFMVGRGSFQLDKSGRKRILTSTVGMLIMIVAVVGINIGMKYLPLEYVQFDLTNDKWYSISDETTAVLDTLEEEVTIYVIADENAMDDVMRLYLNAYQGYSNNIQIEYRPLDSYPNFAFDFTGTELEEHSMIVSIGDQFRTIPYANCYVVEYGQDPYTYETFSYVTGFDFEGQITAAIGSLISGEEYKVYFLEGHSELEVTDSILSRFIKGGYTVTGLSLLRESEVPGDAVALVINGPQTDLSVEEADAVRDYIEGGGNVIMMASLDILPTPNYDALMEEYGITMTDGSVLEGDYYYIYNGTPFALLPDNEYHEITSNLINENRYALLVQSRGFTIDEALSGDMEVYPLFRSADSSYAKVLSEDATLDYEEGNEVGPFVLGVCTEKYVENGEKAIVTMLGTPVFLYEDYDLIVANANTDIFFSAVNYGSEREVITTIPVKSVEPEYILVSTGMEYLYTCVIVVILPLLMIVAGLIIVITRRKK